MALIVVNSGELNFLDTITTAAASDDWKIELYTNSVSINGDSVYGDFTPPTGAWYTVKDVSGWTSAATDGSGIAYTTASQVSWKVTTAYAGEDVYGYIIYIPGSNNLMLAEAFSTSLRMELVDDEIRITPKLTLHSEN